MEFSKMKKKIYLNLRNRNASLIVAKIVNAQGYYVYIIVINIIVIIITFNQLSFAYSAGHN